MTKFGFLFLGYQVLPILANSKETGAVFFFAVKRQVQVDPVDPPQTSHQTMQNI